MFYWRWFNRPRHPITRVLIGALGLILLAGVLTLGFFALIAFAVIGAILTVARLLARAGAPRTAAPRQTHVIDGEFVVLQNRPASIKH